MLAQFVNEVFSEKSDPIQDMGIGGLIKIKKSMQGIIDLYGTNGELEKIDNNEEYGYRFKTKFPSYSSGYYSITYNYEKELIARRKNIEYSNITEKKCANLDDCVAKIKEWIEYAQKE
jgi:hypothetical protein